jgi:hypothetical protein
MKSLFAWIAQQTRNLFSWIEVQIEWLKSFFSEPDGKGSSKRLLSAAVVTGFLIPYIKVSIEKSALSDIPMVWAITICGILGINVLDYLVKSYISKAVEKQETKSNGNA